MKNTWSLTKIRVVLALRNKTFMFFGLIMPLAFLFFFVLIFGHGQTGWIAYILGAVLTITVMGSFWGLSVQLVMFREQGILRRFRLAPVGAGALLASSIFANYVLILPAVAAEILICRAAFHMVSWGNLWAVFALVSVGAATFSAFGLIVASVTNTMQETQVINNLLWSAFLFLSGATVPLAVFPVWIQKVALFSPATYLAMGLEAATTGYIGGHELLEELIALAVGLIVAFEVSRQLFRWEPEAKVPGKAKLWVIAALVPFLVFGAYESAFGNQLSRIQKHFQMLDRQSSSQKAR
ncbi:MAG: ABC transporter permease [Candidatus Acidiferrales bacterium]